MRAYSEYSQIDVKWLGVIPSHWDCEKIGALFTQRKEKVSDKDFAPLSVTKNGILPQLSNAAKSNDGDNRKLVRTGDFVINSRSDRKGSCGVSSSDGSVSLINIVLTPRQDLNSRYVHYLLRSQPFSEEYYRYGRGIVADLWTTRYSEMKNIYIPIPPRSEQDQIVRYLDWQVSKTNKLISALKKQIALLKEQKQAVINEVVTKGLDPAVPMKDSCVEWIGEIPAHWSIIKLRSILKPVSVKNRPELPLLSVVRELGVIVRDVDDVESNHNFIPDDLSNYKVVQEGQFAMNKMKAWQGSYGISPYTGIVSPAYFVFDVNFPNNNYFHYAIRSKVYVNFFAKSSDGIRVGQWDLNMQQMKEIPFILPPASEQDEIVAYIPKANAKIEKAIDAISQEIALLKEYRTRLISDVVTGQIDVRDIEVPEFEYIADDVDDVSDDENTDLEEIMEEEE
jgi:type I restriction enzyme S subunit